MKLFEISATVSYAIVIAAETKEQAMAHVEGWESAWDANARLISASAELVDVRELPAGADAADLADEVI